MMEAVKSFKKREFNANMLNLILWRKMVRVLIL